MKNNIIQISSCWFLLFLQRISSQAQLTSFCGRTLNVSSLTIISTPITSKSSFSCCNITFLKSSSEKVTINILNLTTKNPSLRFVNNENELIQFSVYSSSDRSYLKSDIVQLPIQFSLCQLNLPPFEILITNISKSPCKSNQYLCSTKDQEQWCIDETYHCDGFHSCPQGMDEFGCTKSQSRMSSTKMTRTIRGGIVTTIIIFGLLLIIASVCIALTFIYIRRKNQRRRQFTYSLESNSDEWEPSNTGYHLFDNCTNHRRTRDNRIDNVIVDANEHLPITTNLSHR